MSVCGWREREREGGGGGGERLDCWTLPGRLEISKSGSKRAVVCAELVIWNRKPDIMGEGERQGQGQR